MSTSTPTEQVQVRDLERGDLIEMGSGLFREVFEAEAVDLQTTGRRVMLTVSSTNGNGQETMTDLLPFMTVVRRAV